MKKHPAYTQTRALIGALEPRVLLDGAAVATAVTAGAEAGNQVAIIDSSYADTTTINNLKTELESQQITVHIIDANSNGFEQMNADLATETNIDILHFYTANNGSSELHLGNAVVSNNSLDSRSGNGAQLKGLVDKFSSSGQLVIHDESSSAEGHLDTSFLNNLANVVQADASNANADNDIKVAIVDTKITDSQRLTDALANRFDYIYTIDSTSNGLTQLLEKINNDGLANINDLHIYSLGDTGSIQLGSSIINNYNISSFAENLSEVGGLMATDGNILLYGSNIGSAENGQAFVDSFANLTGAHIAASNTQTGRSSLDTTSQITYTEIADWVLEVVDDKSDSIKESIQNQAISAFNYSYGDNGVRQMLDIDVDTINDPHIISDSFSKTPGSGSSFGWSNGNTNTEVTIYPSKGLPVGTEIEGGLLTINAFDVDYSAGEFDAVYIRDANDQFQLLTNTLGHNFLTGDNAIYSATVFDLGDEANAHIDLTGVTEVVIQVKGAPSNTPGINTWLPFSAISGSLSIIRDNAPTANANNYISINPGDSYVLKTADFGFKDEDAGDSLQNIRIDNNFTNNDPHVTLLLDGVAVTANQEISAGAITQGRLVIQRDTTNNASSFSFGYEVSDGYMYSDSGSLQPTLHINTPPTLTAETVSLIEDSATTLTDSGTLNWDDVDDPGPAPVKSDTYVFTSAFDAITPSTGLTLTSAQQTALANGSFSVDAHGQWSYGIANSTVDFLAGGESVAINYLVTVTDKWGGKNTDSVTVTIQGTNDAPVITSGATGSVNENAATSTVIYTATATDVDSDNISYSLSGTDAGLLNINASTGTVTLKDSADYETKSSYSFNVIATDNGTGNLTDTQGVTVSINDVNEAPVVTSGATGSVNENADTSTVIYTATGTDVDSDTLTYSLSGADVALLNINATTGKVTLKNAADYETKSSYSFNVIATDDGTGALSATKAVTVSVNNVNDAPVITSGATGSVNENAATSTVIYTATATDADGDNIRYSLSGTDAALLDIDASTGKVTLKQAADYETKSSYSFNVIATDDGAGHPSDTQAVNVSVNNVNEAPIVSSNTVTVNENATGSPLGLTAPRDVDGDALTITVTGLPTLGTVKMADGTTVINGMTLTSVQLTGLVYDAPTNYNGTDSVGSFSYSVTDGKITTPVTGSVAFTVNAVNDAPMINSTISTLTGSVTEDSTLTATGSIIATDVDSSNLTFSGSATGTYGSLAIDSQTGVWTYTLDNANQQVLAAGEQHSDSFTLTVNDGDGGSASKTVTISVNGSNDAPTLVLANSGAVTEERSITDGNLSASGSLSAADIDNGDSLTLDHSFNNVRCGLMRTTSPTA